MQLSARSFLLTLSAAALPVGALTACAVDGPVPTAPVAAASAAQFDRGTNNGSAPGDASMPLTLNPDLSAACGFPVYAQFDGKVKELALPGERIIQIYPGLTATFVNGATGATVRLPTSGTLHINPLPGGGEEYVFLGNNGVILEDGFFVISGRFTMRFDAAGNQIGEFERVGRRVDVCALLRG
jgi:hypothetical protein